jgi:hemerythrin-like metal-binding protein
MAIVWSPALAVGIDLIDSQHRELFVYVDALLRASASAKTHHELLPTVLFLGAYLRHHFGSEEMLMDVHGYENAEQHKAEHVAFLVKYQLLTQRIGANGIASSLPTELQREVRDWLLEHVSTTDRALGRFLDSESASPGPRRLVLAGNGKRH